jgi:hypothetical protein
VPEEVGDESGSSYIHPRNCRDCSLNAGVAAAGVSDGEDLDIAVAPTIRDNIVADDQPAHARTETRRTRVREFGELLLAASDSF